MLQCKGARTEAIIHALLLPASYAVHALASIDLAPLLFLIHFLVCRTHQHMKIRAFLWIEGNPEREFHCMRHMGFMGREKLQSALRFQVGEPALQFLRR